MEIDNDVKNEIRTVITKNIRQNLKNKVSLTYADEIFGYNLKTTKLFIENNKDTIFFTKSDKGNVTVCISVDAYKPKIKLLLNNNTNTYNVTKRLWVTQSSQAGYSVKN